MQLVGAITTFLWMVGCGQNESFAAWIQIRDRQILTTANPSQCIHADTLYNSPVQASEALFSAIVLLLKRFEICVGSLYVISSHKVVYLSEVVEVILEAQEQYLLPRQEAI
jgi:hypothetical protein